MNSKALFDAIRQVKGAALTQADVDVINAALAAPGDFSPARGARTVPKAAVELAKSFEGCELTAYPDPGTRGDPWTIGWGATGPEIHKGVVWTQQQADDRFVADFAKFAAGVDKAIGAATTTVNQFGAMVSLAYNIGLTAFAGSTLLKAHKAGDVAKAQAEFAKWNRAGGKVMNGLVRRRAAEAKLYGTP